MKNKYVPISRSGIVLLWGFLIIAGQGLKAQDVLKVIEKDQDNKYLDVHKQVKPAYINPNIVDINSTLLISIDKAAIIKKLGQTGQFNLPKETSDLLDLLNNALKKQAELLNDFKSTIASYNPGNPDSARKYNQKLQNFGQFANGLFKTDPKVRAYFVSQMSVSPGKIAENVFVALQKRITDMENDLAQLNTSNPNSIQLGAWINKGGPPLPLHLAGFDQLADQPYYTVERWQYLPTADQIDQYTQLQDFAKKNRDSGLDLLKASLNQYLDAFKAYAQKLLDNNLTDLTNAYNLIKNDYNGTPISGEMLQLKTDFETLSNLIKTNIAFYNNIQQSGNISTTGIIAQVINDISTINQTIAQAKADVDGLNKSISLLPPKLKQEGQSLVNLLKSKYDSLFTSIDTKFLSAVGAGYQTDIAALEYSDKVLKLSLTDLPLNTELDLNNTGERKAGDKISLKISTVSNGKTTNLDSYTVTMYRVLIHLEGTVGLLFAHPLVHTDIRGDFQMAPYFNLLFKGVWPWTENYHRRSAINNGLLDFSFGLQVSSPDFNKDDVPELGVGLVLSGFKDILQVGIAHNVFLSKPFVFFGIRLPIPATNFGSNGQTNSSVQ
ncbi:hypothetical protein [Mucilaginibacter sp.]|uniref:hypothetical protein n=1 Tax=Mucilaginibacter sp. TaxID=1882438 RepID=UPI00262581C1|nr:hypothetical protein [Mucilaginibacter sp.]MDB4920728.1 hypothetical protein [Mucilaginibacter sp.]